MRVLVVDDEARSRRGLERMVRSGISEDADVRTAADGPAALAMIRERPPDVLLSDIAMPGMDGLEMIALVRDEVPGVMVVIITGYDEFSYAKRAVDLGVAAFLLKPVTQADLNAVLTACRRQIRDHQRADLVERWSLRELEHNLPFHRNRFFLQLLGGPLQEDDVEVSSRALGLARFARGQLFVGLRRDVACEVEMIRREVEQEHPESVVLGAEVDRWYAFLLLGSPWDTMPATEALQLLAQYECDPTGAQAVRAVRAVDLGWLTVRDTFDAVTRDLSVADSPLIRSAENLIQVRYAEADFSLKRAAKELHVTPSHLSREFTRRRGQTFLEALSAQRVRAAADYLERGDAALRIYEIAERCGFSSQHYFSRVFRLHTGMTPKAYRSGRGV